MAFCLANRSWPYLGIHAIFNSWDSAAAICVVSSTCRSIACGSIDTGSVVLTDSRVGVEDSGIDCAVLLWLGVNSITG